MSHQGFLLKFARPPLRVAHVSERSLPSWQARNSARLAGPSVSRSRPRLAAMFGRKSAQLAGYRIAGLTGNPLEHGCVVRGT